MDRGFLTVIPVVLLIPLLSIGPAKAPPSFQCCAWSSPADRRFRGVGGHRYDAQGHVDAAPYLLGEGIVVAEPDGLTAFACETVN